MQPEPEKTDSTYAELVQQLKRATDIEQALMAQYLYAAFAIRPKYESLRGLGGISGHYNLLGVAIEEMRHLHIASLLLSRLNAHPNLVPVAFPLDFHPYKFELGLKPLSSETLALYVYIEAQSSDVSLSNPDHEFITRLKSKLGNYYDPVPPDSIYGTIISKLTELTEDLPDHLQSISPELPLWIKRLEAVKDNGVKDHFTFFRDIFMGTSPLVADSKHGNVWDLSTFDPDYPSYSLLSLTSVDGERLNSRKDETRQHVRLAALHYWIILSLLNLTYRFDRWDDPEDDSERRYLNLAQRHMRGPLLKLGAYLASNGVGFPFVAFPEKYTWDNEAAAKKVVRAFVSEAHDIAHDLFKKAKLANGLKLNIYSITTGVLSSN